MDNYGASVTPYKTLINHDYYINILESVTGKQFSEHQKDILRTVGGLDIVACAGSGKALKNGTGVLTPSGYKPIEKLRVGDICYDADGKEQTVLGVFPQGKKEVYNINFSDGTTISCCKDHLWNYQTYNMRRTTKKWKTDTVEYLYNNVPTTVYPHTNSKGETQNRKNIYIPMCKPVQFKGEQLPIKPYTMGALLGDGCISGSSANCQYSFSNLNEDVVARVAEELKDVGATLEDKGDGRNFKILVGTGYGYNNTEGKMSLILKELGIKDNGSHEKHIPKIYKFSSIEDRIAFVQGLIDTDGHCNGTSYGFTSVSEQLVDDLKFVLETLGVTAVKSIKDVFCTNATYDTYCGIAFRLYIKPSDLIPKLHWSKYRDNQWRTGQTSARRTIESIDKTGKYEEMTCIKVSGESGLFLTENCIVTHNTTMLLNLIAKRIMSGEIRDTNRLLCTTYSKGGAEEITERLNLLLAQCGLNVKITVKTMHATYYQILSAFGVNLSGAILTEYEKMTYLKDIVKDIGVRLEEEDMETLANLLAIQINELLSEEELYNSYHFTLDDLSLDDYKKIRQEFNNKKTQSGKVDFDDLQLFVYNWLCVDKIPQVIQYCHAMWDYFYVDEFQDTNKIQYSILRAMVSDPTKLMVIGDDDQCIYGWRGADPNIILNITAYYDLTKHILPVNYRCGKFILKHAATGVEKMSWREPKDMSSYKGNGAVEFHDVTTKGGAHLLKMSRYARDLILDAINKPEYGITAKDIAVLVRNNKDAQIMHALLFKCGIYCGIQENMKMTRDIIFKDIMQLLETRMGIMPRVEGILWKLIPYLGAKGSKTITDMMTSCGCRLEEALNYLLNVNYTIYSQGITGVNIPDVPERIAGRARYLASGMKPEALAAVRDLIMAFTEKDNQKFAELILYRYRLGVEFMYEAESSYRYMSSILRYIEDTIKESGFDGAMAFFRSLKQFEDSNTVGSGPKLTLGTMHGSKGKEWKMVIILGDDNLSCPSYHGIRRYLDKGIEKASIGQYLDGERRLHYVAQTRAIDRLILIADMTQLSVFEMECLDIFKKVSSKGNNEYIIRLAEDSGGSKLEKKAYDALIEKLKSSQEDGIYYIDASGYNG